MPFNKSFEDAARYWKDSAAATRAADPETKLLDAIGTRGRLPLPEVPGVLNMTAEQAVHVVESLRARQRVAVIEQQGSTAKYLRLK